MPNKWYIPKLAGLFLIGVVSLVIAAILFIMVSPILIPIAFGAFFFVLVFLAIWVFVYLCILIGAMVYFFFRPMQWEKEDKGYSLSKEKESGMRQKGKKKRTKAI